MYGTYLQAATISFFLLPNQASLAIKQFAQTCPNNKICVRKIKKSDYVDGL